MALRVLSPPRRTSGPRQCGGVLWNGRASEGERGRYCSVCPARVPTRPREGRCLPLLLALHSRPPAGRSSLPALPSDAPPGRRGPAPALPLLASSARNRVCSEAASSGGSWVAAAPAGGRHRRAVDKKPRASLSLDRSYCGACSTPTPTPLPLRAAGRSTPSCCTRYTLATYEATGCGRVLRN